MSQDLHRLVFTIKTSQWSLLCTCVYLYSDVLTPFLIHCIPISYTALYMQVFTLNHITNIQLYAMRKVQRVRYCIWGSAMACETCGVMGSLV
uniref:Uncharacterized protein n=1 Tax=Anguilla anguilla TaxID=7936 RepID=A0A0E9WQT1_ANGAN